KKLARHFYRPTRNNEFPRQFRDAASPLPGVGPLPASGQRYSQYIDAAPDDPGGIPRPILAGWLAAGLKSVSRVAFPSERNDVPGVAPHGTRPDALLGLARARCPR